MLARDTGRLSADLPLRTRHGRFDAKPQQAARPSQGILPCKTLGSPCSLPWP